MKKWYEKVLLVAIVAVLGTLIGCIAFQKAATPAWIEETAKDYIADVNIPCEVPRLWWTSLADVEMVDMLLDYAHEYRQTMLERAKEDDKAWFAVVKKQHGGHKQNAIAFQQELFTPEGTVGALLLAGLGMWVGKLGFSTPQDKRTIEQLKNGKSAVENA